MSRARHRASGGKVAVYAGEDSNVLKDAKERKKGGAVMGEGDMPKMRADKRARGGRMRGGAVGADTHPLTTAAKVSAPKGGSGAG